MTPWSPAATPSRVWPSTMRGDRDVGQQPHRQACPDRRPGHGGDDRLGAVDDAVDDVAGLPHGLDAGLEVPGHLLDHREVAPGGEGAVGPGDNHDRDVGIAVDIAPDPGQLLVLGGAHGIEPPRGVEDDPQDAGLGELEVEVRVVAVGHVIVFSCGAG